MPGAVQLDAKVAKVGCESLVSRHLAILREAGLLTDRRDGTYVTYRFTPPAAGPWRDTWALVSRNLREDPTSQRDRAALGDWP